MTLTQFRHQHRYWAAPLVWAMLVSWCALLCLPEAQAAPASETVVAVDCHGQPIETPDTPSEHQNAHADCQECDPVFLDLPTYKQFLQFAAFTTWLDHTPLALTRLPTQHLIPPPIPPPTARLHLLKSVFLI